MPQFTTTFPQSPTRFNDAAGIAWTIWQNILWSTSVVFDVFVNKFDEGNAVVAAGQTFVAVGHGLAVSNYAVVVTPTADPGSRFWVSNKTSTQFRINLQTAPGGAVAFDWSAKAA